MEKYEEVLKQMISCNSESSSCKACPYCDQSDCTGKLMQSAIQTFKELLGYVKGQSDLINELRQEEAKLREENLFLKTQNPDLIAANQMAPSQSDLEEQEKKIYLLELENSNLRRAREQPCGPDVLTALESARARIDALLRCIGLLVESERQC